MLSVVHEIDYEYNLSIVVLTYNHSSSISRALQSVVEQDFDLPVQIVISDDASQDDTGEHIQALMPTLKAKFNVCLTVHGKNIGPSSNFLYSTQQCKGKFIAYLEGDDWWIDTKHLTRSYARINAGSGIAVVCNGYRKAYLARDRPTEVFSVESEAVVQYPKQSPYFPHLGASVWINHSVAHVKEYVLDRYDDNVHFALLKAKGTFVFLPFVSLEYVQSGTGEWTKNTALQKCDRLLSSTERERQMYRDGYVNDLLPMTDNLTQCLYWLYEAREKAAFVKYAQLYIKYSLVERRLSLRMLLSLFIKTLLYS